MAKVKLNGREMEVKDGENLLKVCLDNGANVPHFCYHPGLQPEGNCRMCLVKVSTSRKLEVACMTRCSDKLEVVTDDESVQKARKDVLELLLANHPLDCPICDKAGECDLQDFTFKHRGGLSRMDVEKVHKPTKDLGPDIRIWGERCVVCTRCVRFLRDEVGTGELGVVNRGDHNVVDVFPGIPIDNPLSLNVVDICPVGALIDKNFMYQARVWYAKEVDSVCPSCSRGCNVKVTAMDDELRRMLPRRNDAVNGFWMCDEGRLNTAYIASERRLLQRRGTPSELSQAVRDMGGERVGALVSTWQTVEELFLFKKLVAALGIRDIGFLTQTRGERWKAKGGFTIEPDRTPNRRFAELLWGREVVGKGMDPVIQALKSGSLQGLLVLNGIPNLSFPPELEKGLERLGWIGIIDVLRNPVSDAAHVALPGATFVEKDGTFMNVDGRIQRIRSVLNMPGSAQTEVLTLQEALLAIGAREKVLSAERIFREAAAEIPALSGLDYGSIGTQGVATNGAKG